MRKGIRVGLSTAYLLINVLFATAQIGYERGRIIEIKDGDTGVILSNLRKSVCRFQHVDSPEKRQRWGAASTDSIKGLLLNKVVDYNYLGLDLYGRKVIVITHVNNKPMRVDSVMIVRGWTWHNAQFCNCIQGKDWQRTAQCKKLGIWHNSTLNCEPVSSSRNGQQDMGQSPLLQEVENCPPIEPWTYRRLSRRDKIIYDKCQ